MRQYSTTNEGTALTPRMQAAVERRKAGVRTPKHTSPFMDEIEQLRAMLDNDQQTIRERDAKIENLSMVSENAKALLKDALEREAALRDRIARIAGDFHPDREADASLALQEMREAVLNLAAPKGCK